MKAIPETHNVCTTLDIYVIIRRILEKKSYFSNNTVTFTALEKVLNVQCDN